MKASKPADLAENEPTNHPDEFELRQSELGEPERPRKRRWRRYLKLSLVLVVILILGYAGFIGYQLSKISDKPFSLVGLGGDSTGRVNILVLGEGDPGHAGEGLTDTMMVLSLNRSTHQIAEISVPRDLRVAIPGHGTAKINEANALGGVSLAEQTVSNTLGIPIDGYISTDFSGLKAVVDAVGGLDVNVASLLHDSDYPCDDNQYAVCGLTIQPGLQHMNGTTVLQYTRCRKGTCGNDFGRAARQQQILGLLRQKVVQPSFWLNPVKDEQLATALRSTISTNLSSLGLIELARGWQQSGKNPTIQLVLSTDTGGYLVSSGSSSDLLPAGGSFGAIQSRVQNIFTVPVQPGDVPAN